jgi:hypothetical protein
MDKRKAGVDGVRTPRRKTRIPRTQDVTPDWKKAELLYDILPKSTGRKARNSIISKTLKEKTLMEIISKSTERPSFEQVYQARNVRKVKTAD